MRFLWGISERHAWSLGLEGFRFLGVGDSLGVEVSRFILGNTCSQAGHGLLYLTFADFLPRDFDRHIAVCLLT